MIVGVIGSRALENSEHEVLGIIEDFLVRHEASLVVSGGARGVDRFAEKVAIRLGIPVEIIHPDWDGLGKTAGFARNSAIAERIEHLLAIMIPGGSAGSKDTIAKMMRMHKPVTIYTVAQSK